MHVRVCRDCGEEYRPEIVSCADCGGKLEDRYEEEQNEERRSPPPAEAPAPPAAETLGYRPVFVTGRAAALVPLAERLREAGIDFRLREAPKEPRASAASFSLLVRDEDAERALRELAPLLGEGDVADDMHAVESDFEGGAYRHCPACRTDLPAGALECRECGLALGQAGASCVRCGAPLGPGQIECPACGSE